MHDFNTIALTSGRDLMWLIGVVLAVKAGLIIGFHYNGSKLHKRIYRSAHARAMRRFWRKCYKGNRNAPSWVK